MATNKTKTLALGTMLVLSALAAISGTASAHECETYGEDDADGCNAHSCPDDGETHVHNHNTPWNDWDEIDHYCTSQPTSSDLIDDSIIGNLELKKLN